MGLGPQTGVTAPRVSVIVPVRDRRALLRQLLDALDAQTYRDFEVIVVDDGSRDGSGDEARARPGTRVIDLTGEGAVAARRAGVKAAAGEVLAFTDSDCGPDPGWLAAGVAAVDGGADVVQGLTRPRRPLRPLERSVTSDRADGLYATCNVFYRRRAFEAAGGFDVDGHRLGFRGNERARRLGFGEDTLTGWRVSRGGQGAFAPDAIVEHEVLTPDLADALARAWLTGAFPALVGEVPELRDSLLTYRYFLGSSRLGLYAALPLLATGRRRAAAVALSAWGAWWMRDAWAGDGSPARRLAAVPALLAIDAVAGIALVAGSTKARTLVL
jgi:glycosyltransferase involved in cell wall biosynthesis